MTQITEPSTDRILLHWLPKCNSIRSRPGWIEPEVWFRVIQLAQVGHPGAAVATYLEQAVEIALGPKGVFENGNIGALTRWVPGDTTVSSVLQERGNPNPLREPKTPRVVELLRRAMEWQALLESGKAINQADIARREGITRARVTQVMRLLRLAPEIQEQILSMPAVARRPSVSERMLRSINTITDYSPHSTREYRSHPAT